MLWHPYAEKFPPIEGEKWKEFKADIKKNGLQFPVEYRMVNGQKQGLDGRNRYKACQELKIECPMVKVFVSDEEVEDFIVRRNVLRRGGLAPEVRKEIVQDLREKGQSTRQIAETVGVHHSTVQADLKSTGGNPPVESKKAYTSSPKKVTGKDGKARAASTKPPDPPKPTIPERLQDIFACVEDMEKATASAIRLANRFQEIEGSAAYLAATRGKKHREYSTYIRSAAHALKCMTPARPCPDCGGANEPSLDSDQCKTCLDRGYQTVEDVEEC